MSLASLSTQDSYATGFGAWESVDTKSSWSCLSEIEEMSESLQMSDSYPEGETTIMIRHIPCKYAQEALMQEVLEFTSNFDYFYLPPARTAKIEKNLGYAFVNFRSSYDAQQFMELFQGYQFKMFPNSLKRAQVSYADIQGVEANMESYHQSKIGLSKVYKAKFAPWVSQNKF
jgi:RNA recognition motif-containing protein